MIFGRYKLNKKIWIINQYAGVPQTSNPGRHYYIAKEFQKLGYDVTLILATFTHNRKYNNFDQKSQFFCEKIEGVNYIWVRVPEYRNTHGIGRIRNWFLFYTSGSIIGASTPIGSTGISLS